MNRGASEREEFRHANGRRVNGWINLLFETEDGAVIVDHKSSPRRDAAIRVAQYAPQLRMYTDALEAAGAGPLRLVRAGQTRDVAEVKRKYGLAD